MPNLAQTARNLALEWFASDHWGDPVCSDAYRSFLLDNSSCSEALADALMYDHRSEIQIIRAYAARLVGQMRRAYSFDLMPARQTWPQTGIDYGEDGIDIPDFIREYRRRMAEGGGA